MSEKAIRDFIEGKVIYDKESQYVLISTKNEGLKMLAQLRGWREILKFFTIKDEEGSMIKLDKACEFQDQLGQFIADAINEKIARERESQENKERVAGFFERMQGGYQPTQDDTKPEPPKESGS